MTEVITRENVDRLLDAGMIQVLMQNGKWRTIRRNGATQRWKRDPNRIRIPIKHGFRGTGAIGNQDFIADGTPHGRLNNYFRHKPEAK